MSDEFAEVIDLVNKAQSKGTFSLANAIKGVAYPTENLEIFLDIESAYELSKLNDKLLQTTDLKDTEPLEAKARELADKVMASKLVFKMRGVDQRHQELIEKKSKGENSEHTDETWINYMCALVAANIISVENADGEVDEHVFTVEEVLDLRASLPAESWGQIIATMQKLTLATGYFKGMTDAGFLQKS